MSDLTKAAPPLTAKYSFFLLVIWSALIIISAVWSMYQNHRDTEERALVEARTYFELNLFYRKWGASLGGVYASADKVKPNPYLRGTDRDITTREGKKLTLVNPAYMTRMVFDLINNKSSLSVVNKITSTKYLNPLNAPDEWEKKALIAFENGRKEVHETVVLNGAPHLRLMRPFVTEGSCLRCHGVQGYKEGDVRGGLSIAVPLSPFYKSEAKTRNVLVLTHLLLWLIGSGGIVIFTRSIQRQQQQIAESEWKFRTLSEFAHDWEFWITGDKKIAFVSSSCESITGYTQEEFINDPALLWNIIHPEDKSAYMKHIEDFGSPEHKEVEFRIITKSGRVKWLSHLCGPIYIDDTFFGRRASNRDITDRKKLEEQLIQSQKMESLGLLAGGIAHDFNNALTAIMGYSSLLAGELQNADARTRRFVSHIAAASEKAKEMIANLLTFSRKQIIRPSMISLNQVAGNLSKLLRQFIGEDVELRIIPAEPDISVLADPHQIEQVLMNLATNARDAMPSGGTLSIEITSARLGPEQSGKYGIKPGEYGVILVSDTGSGINKELLPHIFDPFFTTKEQGKGTGLGLSMAYGIVKQHEGLITAYSEKGTGTTFKIYLPSPGGREISGKEDKADESAVDFRGTETILAAEDEDSIRDFLKDTLESYGYKVILAENGADAVVRYTENKERVDMVILDVVMPKKNGKEAYREIREITPGIKTLFISGYTRDILTSRGIYEEGLEFISKPLQVNSLLSKIRNILDAA